MTGAMGGGEIVKVRGERKEEKKAKEKEKGGSIRGGAKETKVLRLDNALKDKPELATWTLRENFKGMATEAKTTMDTFRTRTVFQKSTSSVRRECFPC